MALVSICIPSYNHARFLKDSLRSAMAQSYQDLEIVVLDNASQDDTKSIVADFASRDPRIRYIRHRENLGLVGNLDACLNVARGAYIKILCADDTLEPGCVTAMAKVLDEQPAVSIVGCARVITDVNLAPLRVAKLKGRHGRIPGQKMIAKCFFFGNLIGEPTAVMFRRCDSARGFRRTYKQLVDMEMWFHLLNSGDFFALPQALCSTRSHADQATWANDQEGRIVEDRRRLYVEFAASASRSAGLLKRYIWDFRMAYAMVRSQSAGYESNDGAVPEVFFPRAFRNLTHPMVKLMMHLGLRHIWRTSP